MSNVPERIAPHETSAVARNRADNFPDLDDVRQAFCITYVQNGYKHREAAATVGLSPDRGISLKREPLCAAFIADLQKKYLAESLVTKEMLDMRLDVLEEIAMGEVEVPFVSGLGATFNAKKFYPDLALKIYQERAKLHDFADEENKVAPVNVTINVGAMLGQTVISDDKSVVIEQK